VLEAKESKRTSFHAEAFQLVPDKTPSAAHNRHIGGITTCRYTMTTAVDEPVFSHVDTQRQQHVKEQRQLSTTATTRQ